MSIRARFLLLILSATFIPALVAGVQFFDRRDAEIADAREDLKASAQQIAHDIKDTIRATAQLHYGLSRARDLDTPDRVACSAFLSNVLNEYPQYTGLLTANPNGDLFCDSLKTGRSLNFSDRAYFREAKNTNVPLVVEPVFGRLTGKPVLQIAYPARLETGEMKFMLLASLDLEKFMLGRSRTLPRPNTVLALVDAKGTVMTWFPGGEKLGGTSIKESPLYRFSMETADAAVRENIESGGVSRIWATSAVPEYPAVGLHVLVGISKQDLLAAANKNLNRSLAILLIVWLLVFAVAWRMARGVMDRELAEGSRIRELNEMLEQRVLERTAGLESVNQALNREINERKQSEQALIESQDRFRKIVEQSPLSMVMVGKDGTIDFINRKAIETFGYLAEEIPDMRRWWAAAFPDQAYREEVLAQWTQLVDAALAHNQEVAAQEYQVTCKDGKVKTVATFGVWVADQLLIVFEDISQRKEAEEQIRTLAYFDPLTRLPNRRLVLDRLGQALISSKRTAEFGALMILDLDNFKALNDTKGHDAGDRLLIEVAKRIVANVRPEDTVSRLGGDEYVVMVEGLDPDETVAAGQAEMIAEKIRVALNQPYLFYRGGHVHHSTPSIGVTLFKGNELALDIVLKQADMALYQAKGAGRNAVRFFNPAMQAAIESRSRMEAALRNGLQNGEFQLFYQIQVDQAGQATGAEALLRWMSADQGPVSPANFIPLAEDTGLIIPLGLWVMQTACAQLRTWSEHVSTRELRISINVSARQFRQANFVEQVFDTLKQTGADPTLLKLELTESVVLENVDDVIIRMQQIKALGVTFSLDDFGTGFSSLSYLKRLPLDEVKIDQSFVRDVNTDPNDAAIVRAIIAMSGSLGVKVIAEGVETEAQLDFLKQNGCVNFQGYLFGKPKAIDDWE
ncbi:hypothetical protein BH11PSE11_BH11PSE11_30250 [soil metagenome]